MTMMVQDNVKTVESDLLEASSLVKDVSKCATGVLSSVQDLLKRAKNDDFQTSKGISFLDVKYHMLLNYLTNLTYVILKKVLGKKIENDAAIERLVEMRTVLEKMKPVDLKLKYEIQKLLTAVTTGNVNVDDPLRFKANPDNLINQHDEVDSDDNESEDEEKKDSKSNVYVPPKISAMYYEGDETQQSRKQKILERVQKRALSSSMLHELKKEYDVGPEEIKEVTDVHKQKVSQDIKERTRYEEEYMLRLPLTKKQRHDARKIATVSSLSGITKFDDISALDLGVDDVPLEKKKSSKKFMSKKGKGKKKTGFRRRRY